MGGNGSPWWKFTFGSLGGSETVGELFTYSIKLKTPDTLNLGYVSPAANLQLKPMVGNDRGVKIELDGGGNRYITGRVTAAPVGGLSGRGGGEVLRLDPWGNIRTHPRDQKG
ncbi:hypothetical protein KCA24_33765 [Escherichia coli]|nr:hypothetical protein [Escherichia coli]